MHHVRCPDRGTQSAIRRSAGRRDRVGKLSWLAGPRGVGRRRWLNSGWSASRDYSSCCRHRPARRSNQRILTYTVTIVGQLCLPRAALVMLLA